MLTKLHNHVDSSRMIQSSASRNRRLPRRHKDGLRGFFWPRYPYKDTDALLQTQRALREAIADLTMSRG